jgi:hypothetical protein
MRHLVNPELERGPIRRSPITGMAQFYLMCGQMGTIMDVLQISGHRLCPACEALAIAAGAEVG